MHLFIPSLLFLSITARLASAASTITIIETRASGSPSQPQATSTSYTDDDTFRGDVLDAHNFYRKEHNTSALVWNTTSARFAASYSSRCQFKHSGGPTGENLAAGYPNASASVDGWGLEREKYNFNKPGFSEDTGHFTQLVWANTTSVGCGRANCSGENGTPGWYVVCEYYPPGNVEGEDNQFFKDNVRKQTTGKASDTVESGITTSSAPGWGDVRWAAVVLGGAILVGWAIVW
ncbi:CAP domain-containing protein [Xylogone sp. PMI_703]|nr:CAP domain-containing protein [Xylogone sp. PMI_703]